jgi:two-component system, chemotaxis family, sensor kinase Cph1
MSVTPAGPRTPVDLNNCDREPIHVPGSIQPHGWLLAFDLAGALSHASANAAAALRAPLAFGSGVEALGLDADGAELSLLREAFAEAGAGNLAPNSVETTVHGVPADLVVHAHEGRVIAEWETRRESSDEVASFALKAHRMIDRLRRHKGVEAMLGDAVEQVRRLTGFDRVMAYRFRHDDSGEVLAEARDAALDPYLGLRYPASDIPAQARRLYVLNTLRLIGDVGYAPLPVHARDAAAPLDMSHCVLRSVSPIHVEYLQNIGVGASMSVSIVVGGRLWGLIACHHRTPRHVPYSVRMACDVLAQVLASTVSSLVAAQQTIEVARAAATRTGMMESVLHSDDILAAVLSHEEALRVSLHADALIVAEYGKLVASPQIDEATATAIVQSLQLADDGGALVRTARGQWPEQMQQAIGPWIGALALPFNPAGGGWIVALRREQVQEVRWGNQPLKQQQRSGPLGPRLTPHGSMREWSEVVRGTAEPWSGAVLDVARELLAELRRAVNARFAETDRVRTQLMAMLGHDLRDPLASIHMAASLMQRGVGADQLGHRISNASGRMQRLIDHVMDLSRISGGIGLGLRRGSADLARVLQDLISESRIAHPGVSYIANMPESLLASIDVDRIAQVFGNLLSNARHHGEIGRPIQVDLEIQGAHAVIDVRNAARPIDPAVIDSLFSPFKHQAAGSERKRSGLGLGLFIAQQIVAGHGGMISYRFEEPHVTFRVTIPLDLPPAAS